MIYRAAASAALACTVATSASAQATLTWVSSAGDDANPCSRASPCQTFAGAFAKTAAGGEIDCLDSGDFGPLTITKAITISCEGVIGSTGGITVAAGATDKVVLIGLHISGGASPPPPPNVSHTTGMVDSVQCDIWTWIDSAGQTRTVALKMEGNGNTGHGGYAVQMTYYYDKGGTWTKVTVDEANAASGDTSGDGGFGYFVSHERYRNFADGDTNTIAGKIFGVDDSPLGLGFAATAAIPLNNGSAGAESFTINYYHYGTVTPGGYDANTGVDQPLLPTSASAYQLYHLPVTTTWVFQSGRDYPRIDVSIDMSQLIPPGLVTPTAGLVSFDVRGPYGVMVFDNDLDGVINTARWGDQQFIFAPTKTPITRGSAWTWNATNPGARYNLISIGTIGAQYYEMGLYEPAPVSGSSLTDGFASERGYTSLTYASAVAAGNASASTDQCGDPETLPSDGTWPYQSVQYSLPCGQETATTDGQKIAWGSSSLYGFNQTSAYNGQQSFPINNFPAAPYKLNYSVCVVLGAAATASASLPYTVTQAALYTAANPKPLNADCATSTY
jgi:hypothetical protein